MELLLNRRRFTVRSQGAYRNTNQSRAYMINAEDTRLSSCRPLALRKRVPLAELRSYTSHLRFDFIRVIWRSEF
jgi:hypothetical protein